MQSPNTTRRAASPFFCLLGFITLAIASMTASGIACAGDTSPRLVSKEFQEIDSFVYPRANMLQQSGERVIVDASLIPDEDGIAGNNEEPSEGQFHFSVPSEMAQKRLCVEFANVSSGFRKVSLLRLTGAATDIDARIESPAPSTLLDGGAVFVAFPASELTDNPVEACRRQEQWLYPARTSSAKRENKQVSLQLLVNAGGGEAYLAEMSGDGTSLGRTQCEREENKGLYTRVCKIKLSEINLGSTSIRLVIRPTNGSPTRITLRASVGESSK